MTIEFKAQPGPQTAFCESKADIIIFGGAAGGGKTWINLFDATKWLHVPDYRAIMFRRTLPQVKKPGSIQDESMNMYPHLSGSYNKTDLKWSFPKGSSITFSHLQYDETAKDHQGGQYCGLLFEELTHFTEKQFWYLYSRNRSNCGVKPFTRGTCNPDPDSFVKKLILWWLDENGEYPDYSKSGVLRWFLRIHDKMIWADTKEELEFYKGKKRYPKSLTFIPSSVEDNKKLLEINPEYLGNLDALDHVEYERLKKSNWKIRPAAGLYYKREQFTVVDSLPNNISMVARAWDQAATEISAENDDPDATCGLKGFITTNKDVYITDMRHGCWGPGRVDDMIHKMAVQDGRKCTVGLFQDPAGAGKNQSHNQTKMLTGFAVETFQAVNTGGKLIFAKPCISQAQKGNIYVLRAPWNELFFKELEGFPTAKHDDIVDALSLLFYVLTTKIIHGGGVAKSAARQLPAKDF